MIKALIQLLLITVSFQAAAQITNIPDPYFEQTLIDFGIDSDGEVNGQVLTSDVENLTELILEGPEGNILAITDLTGIEAFTSLEHLQITFSEITELNVSQNTQLKILDCRANWLTSLDVSSNSLLEELYIGNEADMGPFNEIAAIDLSNNPNIQILTARDMPIEIINLKNGNNETSMSIDIGFTIWDEDPEDIVNTVCIEVDDAALAQANQPPYSGWEIDHTLAAYNFAEDCNLSSHNVELAQMISIYPNPASDVLHIVMQDEAALEKVQLYDISGRLVREYGDVSGISVNGLEKGMYILKVFADKGNYSERIIVE